MEQINGYPCRGCLKKDVLQPLRHFTAPIGDYLKDTLREAEAVAAIPFDLCVCRQCALVQIYPTWDVASLYKDYKYRTKTTRDLTLFYGDLAKEVSQDLNLRDGDLVLDIGCGDGTLLEFFAALNVSTFGIDPNADSLIDNRKVAASSLNAFFEFLNASILLEIKNKMPRAVFINYTLANVNNLDDFLRKLYYIGTDDTIFYVITGDYQSQFRNLMFDYVSHDHLSYFSKSSLNTLISNYGFEQIESESLPFRGGSFLVKFKKVTSISKLDVKKGGYLDDKSVDVVSFIETQLGRLDDNIIRFKKILSADSTFDFLLGVGASTSTIYLANILGLHDRNRLKVIFDDDAQKQGKFTPSSAVNIRPISDIGNYSGVAIVLAWQHTETLIARLRQNNYRGLVVVPLPILKVFRLI